MLLAADETGVTGLWFAGQKYFARHLDKEHAEKEIPLFATVKHWLDVYFAGREPDFTVAAPFYRHSFSKRGLGDPLRHPPTAGRPPMARSQSSSPPGGACRICRPGPWAAPSGIIQFPSWCPATASWGWGGSLTGYAGGLERKRCPGWRWNRAGERNGDTAMTKILFVCHGNICRSPMAEYRLRALVREAGLQARITGRFGRHQRRGARANPVYPAARRQTGRARHRLRRARGAPAAAGATMTGTTCSSRWTKKNLAGMRRICGGDPAGKMRLLLSLHRYRRAPWPDPWYTGDFEAAWQDIDRGCRALLAAVTKP